MTGGEASGVRLGRSSVELLLRRVCALVVAGVAAYASYRHQRAFALEGGADAVSAALWPLSVDGLLVLASVGLLKSRRDGGRRARVAAWSLWPPVALLLAVELLAQHRPPLRHPVETDEVETRFVAEVQSADPRAVAGTDLLAAAIRIDEDHWVRWGRPASAETVRKELRIGAVKARALTRVVRDMSRHVVAGAPAASLDELLSEADGVRPTEPV